MLRVSQDDVIRVNPGPNGWRMPTRAVIDVGNTVLTLPIDYKGAPLPVPSPWSYVPKDVVDLQNKQVILASNPVRVAGSFAPNVSEGSFSVLVTESSFMLFYDGSNTSLPLVQRRSDGYSETLPAGKLTCRGITPGAPGAPGPFVSVMPYFVPGTCNISFVEGDGTSPDPTNFCFAGQSVPARAYTEARSRGREPLTEGPLIIQLAMAPDVASPGSGMQVGNSTTNGTLTVTLDSPGQNGTVNTAFSLMAHAVDAHGHNISGWDIYADGGTQPIWSYRNVTNNIMANLALSAAVHTLTLEAWNDLGTMAAVTISVNVVDNTGTTTGGGGVVTPPPPPPNTSGGNLGGYQPPIRVLCVMLGTVIETLGPSPWHQEQFPQYNWVRIYTKNGRELICTPEHPVFTARAGRTEARDVRKQDMIVTQTGEEEVVESKAFNRAGIKVCVHMDWGHLFWANGILSHNIKVDRQVLGL
jgi:hypothetical protein